MEIDRWSEGGIAQRAFGGFGIDDVVCLPDGWVHHADVVRRLAELGEAQLWVSGFCAAG